MLSAQSPGSVKAFLCLFSALYFVTDFHNRDLCSYSVRPKQCVIMVTQPNAHVMHLFPTLFTITANDRKKIVGLNAQTPL